MYDKILAEGHPEDKAIVLSNVFRNAYYMGCKYPDTVMD